MREGGREGGEEGGREGGGRREGRRDWERGYHGKEERCINWSIFFQLGRKGGRGREGGTGKEDIMGRRRDALIGVYSFN